MIRLAYCPHCGFAWDGDFITTPSDDGRYTYTWGPPCPKCHHEGRNAELDGWLPYIEPEDIKPTKRPKARTA